MNIWWCVQHANNAFQNQPDNGCWARYVDGKECLMVEMQLWRVYRPSADMSPVSESSEAG